MINIIIYREKNNRLIIERSLFNNEMSVLNDETLFFTSHASSKRP